MRLTSVGAQDSLQRVPVCHSLMVLQVSETLQSGRATCKRDDLLDLSLLPHLPWIPADDLDLQVFRTRRHETLA